ncbi:MAG: hypothetical protein N2053_04765 [Chitinispirillaceae bacterium]|nr:hypothetical protein [Chitinispirillaceae bacterium]
MSISFGYSAEVKRKPMLGFTILKANGIDATEAEFFSKILLEKIKETGVYTTIDFSELTLRLSEQGFADTCNDAQCAIIAGQVVGSDFFGFGSIGMIGKSYIISMQLVEVRTGKIVRDVSEFYKGKRKDFEEKIIPLFALKLCGIYIEEKGKKKR